MSCDTQFLVPVTDTIRKPNSGQKCGGEDSLGSGDVPESHGKGSVDMEGLSKMG